MGVIKKSRRHSGRECRNPEARDGDAEPDNCACCEGFNYSSERYLNCYATSVLPHPYDLDSGIPCRNDVASFNLTELPKGKGIVTAFPLPLHALTAAALVLPGLLQNTAYAAEEDSIDFQYTHYQEGKRDIAGLVFDPVTIITRSVGSIKTLNPIEADSLHGSARISLTDRVKFAFNYTQDTWGGATPIATAPAVYGGNDQVYAPDGTTVVGASPIVKKSSVLFDSQFNPVFENFDADGNLIYTKSRQLTHILSTASPETRKQGDFKLTYEWDAAALSIGGGISVEDDYESRFGNLGGRLDFNQKQTTLNVDVSYTNSETHATLDHDGSNFINSRLYEDRGQLEKNETLNSAVLKGTRQDWATHLGITQILGKNDVLAGDFSYTRSTGYMANPYKTVTTIFIDPDSQGSAPPGGFQGTGFSYREQRPEIRNQWNLGGRYVHFIEPLDAAFHFDYRFSADDWGIQAHTFETDWVQPLGAGWTVTPRIRYYSQDAADFYTPWLLIKGAVDSSLLPANFSSDQRLSGFGALSGGVTVSKQFAKGLSLETGFEYYTHQGSLKIGGGGEQDFADFDYWVANAALKVNLAALSFGGGGIDVHAGHTHHEHGDHAPAGVMFDHMLPKAGDFMVGYRYIWSSQSGDILHDANGVSNPAIVGGGCGTDTCFLTPDSMSMSMHMLDLMYAPTDWLTLMLMPQFMDMDMSMRTLDNPDANILESGLGGGGHLAHHLQNSHETGGIGDLSMYALFKLFDNGIHHVHVTAGLSAPTGDVDIQLRRNHKIDGGFIHYGMQLGSGTWDFKPSLTYTGHIDNWSWGAQANGTVRMESQNESGYRLGDLFQATAWGSYNPTPWLTASVRGVYTVQGAISGQFPGSNNQFVDANGQYSSILKFGPMDYPSNYGGRFWDVGFGLSAFVPYGNLAGNRVSVEWLQPVHTDYNGYQLDRDGTLSFTWGYGF